MKQLNKKKAFTLVEVLIVLVILGILTVAVIMGVNWSTDRARESGVQSTLHSYEIAANKVGVQLAGYDNVSLDELVKLLNKSLDGNLKLAISNDVIVSDAEDPWGNTIKIGYNKPNETNGQLKFTSAGPNGVIGDNDDISITVTHLNAENGNGNVVVEHVTPVEGHIHEYSAQVQSPQYLVTPGTCTAPAKYYVSCSCGDVGYTTFNGDVDSTNHTNVSTTYVELNDTHHTKKEVCSACNVEFTSQEELHVGELECTLCGAIIHTHTYDQQVTTSTYQYLPASCISKAKYYYSCSCGAKGTETFEHGELAAHSYTLTNTAATGAKVSDANCVSKAVYYKSCVGCGALGTETFEYGDVDLTNHVGNNRTEYTNLNATQHLKKVTCDACNTMKSSTNENHTMNAQNTCTLCNAHTHNFNQKVASSTYLKSTATCTSKAVYYKSCTCGEKGTETFESGTTTAHNMTNTVNSTYLKSAANCISKAVYYRSCSYCGLKDTVTFENGNVDTMNHVGNASTTYESLNATQHTKKVTCDSCHTTKSTTTENHTMNAQNTCTLCGNHVHNFSRKDTSSTYLYRAADCTNKAIYYYSCVCGLKGTETFNYGSTTAHNYAAETATDTYLKSVATCTAKAVYYKSCTGCGAKGTTTFEVGTFNASNHSKTTKVKATTSAVCWKWECCGAAYDTTHVMVNTGTAGVHQTCSDCGYKTTTHTYNVDSGVQYSAATCTAARKNYQRCSCGYNPQSASYIVSTGSVNANNHTGTSTYGGTSGVHTKYTCCGATISSSHTYDQNSGVKYSDATCTAKQKNYKSCICGYNPKSTSYLVEVGSVNSSNHTGSSTYGGTSGVHTKYTCCGATISSSHTYDQNSGVKYSDATCTAKQKNYKSCVCGYNPKSTSYVVEVGSVNASNHTGSAVNGGTASVHTKYSCCGATISTTHTYNVDSGVQYSAATCTAARKNYQKCSCGYNPQSASYVVSTGSVNSSNHTGSSTYGGTSGVHTKYSCCGATISTSHSYTVDSGVQYTAATCIAARQNYKKCACGYNPKSSSYVVSTGSVNSSNHAGSSTYGGTSGVHTKYTCCGATISSSHTYDTDSGVQYSAATCIAKQKNYKRCACGYNPKSASYVVETGSVNSNNHVGGTYYSYTNLNATQHTKYTKCSSCNASLSSTTENHTLNSQNTCTLCNNHTHSYTQQVVSSTYLKSNATCTAKAVYYYSCVCGGKGTTTFESGNALGHSWTNACDTTCNRDSSHTRTITHTYSYTCDTSCNVCGATRTASHNYQQTKAATCTATGTKTCSYGCGSTQTIAALGHSYTSTYKAGSNATYCTRKCSRCSTYGVSSTAHSWSTTTAATCTADGSAKCSNCSQTKTLTKLGHNPGAAATCTTAQTCQRSGCGAVITAALGHSYTSTYKAGSNATYCTRKCSRCSTYGVSSTTHSWSTTKDSTCTATGTATCSNCSQTKTIAAKGHTGGTATCTAKAVCTRCSTAYGSVDSNNHNYGSATCTDAATCTRCGKTSGAAIGHDFTSTYKAGSNATYCTRKCSRCSTYGVSSKTHSWSTTTAATCTADGAAKCSNCSQTKTLTKLGHNTSGSVAAKAATCTATGVVGGTYCTRCNNGKSAAEATIPALGHSYTSTYKAGSNATYCTRKCSRCSTYGVSSTAHSWSTTTAATCTTDGAAKCSNCSQTKTLTKLGHNPGAAATCTTAQTCQRSGCGVTITAALGHSYTSTYKAGSNATYCTRKCSRCSTYGVSSTQHSWSTTTAATCTANGSAKCSNCSQTKTLTKLGHNTSGSVTAKAATCTATGVVGGTYCTRCNNGKSAAEATIPALGHSYTSTYKAGSNATYCTRKCSRCSTYGVSSTTHSWSTTTAATCTADGAAKCSNCSQTKTLTKLGHAPGSAATCTAAQKCTRCNDTLAPELGHSYTSTYKAGSNATYCTRKCSRCSTYGVSSTTHSWSTTTAATCTATGTSTCSNCSQTKSIAKNSSNHTGSSVYGGTSTVHTKYSCCGVTISSSHSYTVDSGVKYSAATCTAAQKNYKKCACGYNPKNPGYVIDFGGALGHSGSYIDDYTWASDCSTVTVYGDCNVCGMYFSATMPSTKTYTRAATCTQKSWYDYVAEFPQFDGESIACPHLHDAGTAALGHSYTSTYKAGSNATYCTRKCSRCSTYGVSTTTHSWSTTTAATCTAAGTSTCSKCSQTKTITKLGHSYTSKSTTSTYLKSSATCTSAAVYYYKCSRCTSKGTSTYTSGSALGHTGYSGKYPSCTSSVNCTRCGGVVYAKLNCGANGNNNNYYDIHIEDDGILFWHECHEFDVCCNSDGTTTCNKYIRKTGKMSYCKNNTLSADRHLEPSEVPGLPSDWKDMDY